MEIEAEVNLGGEIIFELVADRWMAECNVYSGQFLTLHFSKSRTGLIVSKLTLSSNFTVHGRETGSLEAFTLKGILFMCCAMSFDRS